MFERATERYLHPPRGGHHRFGSHQGFGARAALRRRPVEARRDGLHWYAIPFLRAVAPADLRAAQPATGPNSVFIRVLLDKKYALPYKVVDALVFHFIRFKRDPREMPVLWHQSFLVFCQRSVLSPSFPPTSRLG